MGKRYSYNCTPTQINLSLSSLFEGGGLLGIFTVYHSISMHVSGMVMSQCICQVASLSCLTLSLPLSYFLSLSLSLPLCHGIAQTINFVFPTST